MMQRVRYIRFDEPTQVAFWDVDGNHYTGGIAYGTEIICGCCGGIVDIDEIYEFAPEEIISPIVPYEEWIDLSTEITGSDTTEILLDEEN